MTDRLREIESEIIAYQAVEKHLLDTVERFPRTSGDALEALKHISGHVGWLQGKWREADALRDRPGLRSAAP